MKYKLLSHCTYTQNHNRETNSVWKKTSSVYDYFQALPVQPKLDWSTSQQNLLHNIVLFAY